MGISHRNLVSIILLTIAIFHVLSGDVESKHSLAETTVPVKIIESKGGEIIDCVDIYKQPAAINNPLIKTIQMEPSSHPSGMERVESHPMLKQDWHEVGECPENTIPIRRTQNRDLRKAFPSHFNTKDLNQSLLAPPPPGHEYATVGQPKGVYHGGYATIALWNPSTLPQEISISQIWVGSDSAPGFNSLEAGWIVYPNRYHDSKTRFFIYWTRDGYQQTGCYDLDCPGFVQTNRRFALGATFSLLSVYGKKQFDVTIVINKDKATGNWWLNVQGVALGYWPSSILTGLNSGATMITWGGEIMNRKLGGTHTPTDMGSGHFAEEQYGKAGMFYRIGVLDASDVKRDPTGLTSIVSNPKCYNLHIMPWKPAFGAHFYYGGPGLSAQCP